MVDRMGLPEASTLSGTVVAARVMREEAESVYRLALPTPPVYRSLGRETWARALAHD